MILQVNKKKKENKDGVRYNATTHVDTEIYEDYMDINSIQKNEDGFIASLPNAKIFLSRSREFQQIYTQKVHKVSEDSSVKMTKRDEYNEDNLDFYIDSVYLLDDTGKTIKKIM